MSQLTKTFSVKSIRFSQLLTVDPLAEISIKEDSKYKKISGHSFILPIFGSVDLSTEKIIDSLVYQSIEECPLSMKVFQQNASQQETETYEGAVLIDGKPVRLTLEFNSENGVVKSGILTQDYPNGDRVTILLEP